jgi:hypothetical protein
MQLQERIKALIAFGKHLNSLPHEEISEVAKKAAVYNPWFTQTHIEYALSGILKFLNERSIRKLVDNYDIKEGNKTIGIVMAGNLPLVGFHDLLCVLLAGHKAMIKLSSKDEVLPQFLFEQLEEVAPELAAQINPADKLQDFDAIIATGSNNTSRYFEYYFGKYPNIIRKNRTSVAVLTGEETTDELAALADDMLLYFGMGCRNVSKVLVPADYNFEPLFKALEKYQDMINHNKYRNNYDYYKSIYLVNGDSFLDTGFIMFKQDQQLVSPVSVVYFEYYNNTEEANQYLKEHNEKIQVTVASDKAAIPGTVPPGKAQLPEIDDFADRVDTMKFLAELE